LRDPHAQHEHFVFVAAVARDFASLAVGDDAMSPTRFDASITLRPSGVGVHARGGVDPHHVIGEKLGQLRDVGGDHRLTASVSDLGPDTAAAGRIGEAGGRVIVWVVRGRHGWGIGQWIAGFAPRIRSGEDLIEAALLPAFLPSPEPEGIMRAMRITGVEDDDGVGQAIEAGLKRFEHSPVRFTQESELLLRHAEVEFVILDQGLPDQDGLDVLRQLRQVSSVPLIVLTARNDERSVVRGLRLGADDYLVKPARLRALSLSYDQ
jgi:CheY-like chemotaxis protein